MIKQVLTILIGLISVQTFSQVTINQSDMPSAGDTMRFSVASSTGISEGASGANQTWDFSNLQSTSQFVDEFLPVSSTPITYVFTYSQNSNMARLDNSALQIPTIPFVDITIGEVFNFYKSSASNFAQKGFGASINGFPLPIPYSASDVLVPLPLTTSSTSTSPYSYDIQIPTLGYYGRDAIRNNSVDGWGTLITPFGTFQTLRLRSELVYTDTISIDQLGFGFQLPQLTEVKYKWLAPGYGWPLLEITSGLAGVTKVIYRDHAPNSIGFDDLSNVTDVSIYPNPASEIAVIKSELPTAGTIDYSVFDAQGKLVYQVNRGMQPAGSCMEFLPLKNLGISNGLHFIKIQHGKANPVIRPLLVNNQ